MRKADTLSHSERKEDKTTQEGKRGQALVSAFHGEKKCQGMSKRNPPPPVLLASHESSDNGAT